MTAEEWEYVAIGSSFAAGPGIPPRAPHSPRQAGRSASNYAHVVARRLDLSLADETFSGATIAEMAGLAAEPVHRSQIERIGAATRLVTVTGGGNDIGYLPRLTISSVPRLLRLPSMRRRLTELAEPDATDRAFEALAQNLGALIVAIRARTDALIVVTDYLTILPAERHGYDLGPLPAEIASWGRSVADRLTETISTIARERRSMFVPLATLSRDHHAWADDPWTRRFHWSLRNGAPYHPNSSGMAAAADAIVHAASADERLASRRKGTSHAG